MKRNRMFDFFRLVLFAGSLGVSVLAFAQRTEVRQNYWGARSMAMGGASIAVVNDETALLSNPAGLGKLRDFYGTLIDPEIEGGSKINSMYSGSAFSDPFDLQQVRDTTNTTREVPFHAKAQLGPSIVVRNFGFGVYAKKIMDAQMNPTGVSMPTFYQDDVAIHLGLNLRLFDGRIKFGVVGKAISRIEINKDIDPAGTLSLDQHASEGAGVGADAGIILTAPWTLLPTVSAVIRDVGGTRFTAGSGLRLASKTGTAPAEQQQDMDVALAIFPIHGNRTRSTLTFQYDKVKEAGTATDRSRYYHLGYEFNYADILFLRAGMNQKYWTAGLELAAGFTQWQVTSYGADIGTDGSSVEERRYIFKFAFRF